MISSNYHLLDKLILRDIFYFMLYLLINTCSTRECMMTIMSIKTLQLTYSKHEHNWSQPPTRKEKNLVYENNEGC